MVSPASSERRTSIFSYSRRRSLTLSARANFHEYLPPQGTHSQDLAKHAQPPHSPLKAAKPPKMGSRLACRRTTSQSPTRSGGPPWILCRFSHVDKRQSYAAGSCMPKPLGDLPRTAPRFCFSRAMQVDYQIKIIA